MAHESTTLSALSFKRFLQTSHIKFGQEIETRCAPVNRVAFGVPRVDVLARANVHWIGLPLERSHDENGVHGELISM